MAVNDPKQELIIISKHPFISYFRTEILQYNFREIVFTSLENTIIL